jgi:hypothetical protein
MSPFLVCRSHPTPFRPWHCQLFLPTAIIVFSSLDVHTVVSDDELILCPILSHVPSSISYPLVHPNLPCRLVAVADALLGLITSICFFSFSLTSSRLGLTLPHARQSVQNAACPAEGGTEG